MLAGSLTTTLGSSTSGNADRPGKKPATESSSNSDSSRMAWYTRWALTEPVPLASRSIRVAARLVSRSRGAGATGNCRSAAPQETSSPMPVSLGRTTSRTRCTSSVASKGSSGPSWLRSSKSRASSSDAARASTTARRLTSSSRRASTTSSSRTCAVPAQTSSSCPGPERRASPFSSKRSSPSSGSSQLVRKRRLGPASCSMNRVSSGSGVGLPSGEPIAYARRILWSRNGTDLIARRAVRGQRRIARTIVYIATPPASAAGDAEVVHALAPGAVPAEEPAAALSRREPAARSSRALLAAGITLAAGAHLPDRAAPAHARAAAVGHDLARRAA